MTRNQSAGKVKGDPALQPFQSAAISELEPSKAQEKRKRARKHAGMRSGEEYKCTYENAILLNGYLLVLGMRSRGSKSRK